MCDQGVLRVASRPGVLIWVAVVSVCTGWVQAQTEYTADDAPTALEEEIRWLMNRGRFDAVAENQARGTSYADVPATAGPLAPHESLALASRHHSEDMARQNKFQHATVPGSTYYNATTQPQPWDRMRAEGYSWNSAAENIAAGYGSAEGAYVGWWNSTGHRVNMYNANLREVGNGYFYHAGSSYGRYYTMDLGSSGSMHFFTDTIFRDANGDGAYDQGEGVAGVRLQLRVHGVVHSAFDRSSAAGSFTIPIQSIPDGATVEVLLSNPTATAVTLHVPRTFSSNVVVTLNTGQELVIGTFTQPTGAKNVGLRNLVPVTVTVNPPVLALAASGDSMELLWDSATGVEYMPQWSGDLVAWQDLAPAYVPGTGAAIQFVDPTPATAASLRVYRVLVRQP